MQWSYGVTTVPSRSDELLPRTLRSLAAAGFVEPKIFIDTLPLGALGNWVCSLWHLYAASPQADRYAIFQDDLVTYPNLRQYLEQCSYPEKGYLNLFSFPKNIIAGTKGWYPSVEQDGKSAIGLVFNNLAVKDLLSSRHLVERPQSARAPTSSIDGMVVTALKNQGYQEYVHNPTLVQHTGRKQSTIDPGHNNLPLANTYLGEQFDALNFLQ